MRPLSPTKRRVYFIIFLTLFVIAVPVVIIYAVGYRVDFVESLILTERGGVYVYTPVAGVNIHVDGDFETKTGLFNREYFSQNLKPGRYFIKAEHEDYIPWQKYVNIKAQRVASLYPFFVPKEWELVTVPEKVEEFSNGTTTERLIANEEYETYLELFDIEDELELQEETIKRTFGNIEVSYENEKLYAKWLGRGDWIPAYFCENDYCLNPSPFLEIKSNVENFEFYPGRDDVVIFSTEEGGIYVAEVDTRPSQTVATIYSSAYPVEFAIYDRDVLVIKDKDNIITLDLSI